MNELKKLLKKNGLQAEGVKTLTVTDPSKVGYDAERNVAIIRQTDKGYEVNVNRGHWYKPGEVQYVLTELEVISLITSRFTIRKGQERAS